MAGGCQIVVVALLPPRIMDYQASMTSTTLYWVCCKVDGERPDGHERLCEVLYLPHTSHDLRDGKQSDTSEQVATGRSARNVSTHI